MGHWAKIANLNECAKFPNQILPNCQCIIFLQFRSWRGTREDDVVFHVGREPVMRISAKKGVLVRENEVFRAMFEGPYAIAIGRRRHHHSDAIDALDGRSTGPGDEIYEPDVDARAFKNLIR